MRALIPLLALSILAVPLSAQIQPQNLIWTPQDSGSTAGLRGIHSIDGTIAWASGTEGTILRTTDAGQHWTRCATPDAATDGATLDFRGIQAFDANTAIAMSSGPGEKSRLYKTVDGCRTWTLSSKPDGKDSFWDVVQFQHGDFGYAIGDAHTGIMLGDPVNGRFEALAMILGNGWFRDEAACKALPGDAAFAASNSSAFVFGSRRYVLGIGGKNGAFVLISPLVDNRDATEACRRVRVPIAGGTESSGVFSVFFSDRTHGIAVGGDYTKPNDPTATAAFSTDGGLHWTASKTPPHGYRSTVQYSPTLKAWITAGTNGSDISFDDGRTWQPIDNNSWNALSLPYIVGPKGKIAKLTAPADSKP